MRAEFNTQARLLETQALTVLPGAWAMGVEQPIVTVLGSCVAVCLYDPHLRLGGMNHFMLPKRSGRFAADEILLGGDAAMETLLNAMLARGAHKSRLVAKAFGGSSIATAPTLRIGERNCAFAREWLEREGIPLQASDFGGRASRKIVFEPLTGHVYCRRITLDQSDLEPLLRAERALREAVHALAAELF